MTDWIDEASSKVDDFFESVDDDELEKAMGKADYDFYKEVKSPLGIVEEGNTLFYSLRSVRKASGCMSTPSSQGDDKVGYPPMKWEKPKKAADEHSYAMAA